MNALAAASSSGPGGKDDKQPNKRTKTGCRTCRNRRIKCDETKPYCNNCTKGKRICEGYGPQTGSREAAASGAAEKKSRRFVPYENPERRTYKNIVPAPPKKETATVNPTPVVEQQQSQAVPLVPPSVEPRIHKRKRQDLVLLEQPKLPEVLHDVPPVVEHPYRYGDSNRISISSLLTIDQAALAECAAQQSLNTYVPNFYFSSPLADPSLFAAFKHFVEVVAPTMSLIETSPPNPTILNQVDFPNIKACNLFTFQLPMMALSGKWAIMEAILAISLLHISHVTSSSKQQAFLHYQIAIRRLRIESSREDASRDLGNLAAMLLLAWYELTTGDHLKWVRHMIGAIAVLMGSSKWRTMPEALASSPESVNVAADGEIDMNASAQHPCAANLPLEGMRCVTDEIQQSTGRVVLHELFYLYAKMDVIQALVRGAPPLLELSEWRYPLRGPYTTILGLHDALIYLMARLAHLISSERERKGNLPMINTQNRMPPPSNAVLTSHHSPQSPISTPTSTWSRSSPASSHTDPFPDPTTALAQENWDTLSQDFSKWKDAIDDIRLTRIEPNMPTPFGPAIMYSDVRVAATYMLYLAARIHLNRIHPATPAFGPAAIRATAAQNGPFVAEIMRTQEGFWDSKNFRQVGEREDGRTVGGDGRVADHVISALSNSAWPMLVGGVQVRQEEQQQWMKKRLCDIYELSGFATAIRVRKGLEIAWGHRVRGEPSGFNDIDSDDETEKSLIASEQRAHEREINSRRELLDEELKERRFILVNEGESFLGEYGEDPDLSRAYGVFGES